MKQGLADVTVMDAPIAKYWRSVTPWAAVLSVSESINNYAIAVLFPEDTSVLRRQPLLRVGLQRWVVGRVALLTAWRRCSGYHTWVSCSAR